jgi:hypothetical protein
MKTRKFVAPVLLLLAVLLTAACTPKEIETSVKAHEVCAQQGPFVDSDGNAWSSQNCASHSKVCLAPRPVQVSKPTRWCGTVIEPDATTSTLPTTESAE